MVVIVVATRLFAVAAVVAIGLCMGSAWSLAVELEGIGWRRFYATVAWLTVSSVASLGFVVLVASMLVRKGGGFH